METYAIVKNQSITLKKCLSIVDAKNCFFETAIKELNEYSYDKEKQIIYNTKTNVVIADKKNIDFPLIISEDEKVEISIYEELNH